jgi:hypothetical protein
MSPVTGATMLIHDVSIVTCPNLGDMIVGGIVAYPEELDRHMMFERNQHGCSDWSAGNGGQCATATPAFTAAMALWILQLAESKGRARVRIPLSPPSRSPR